MNDVHIGPATAYGFDSSLFVNGKLDPVAAYNAGLRTNATLREDEWKEIDRAVLEVATRELVGIEDLRRLNLIRRLGGLSTIESKYERTSDMDPATVSMDIVTPPQEDRINIDGVVVPVPIFAKGFRISQRVLEASRRLGDGLDTLGVRVATRKVSEALEDALFNGVANVVLNGNGLKGYTNHPDRNQITGADWGTFANILNNIESAVSELEKDNYPGPYILYVARTQFGEMRSQRNANTDRSALSLVRELYPQIIDIKMAKSLTDEAVLVQMTEEVVDLAVGMDITVVETTSINGFMHHFLVVAAMAPRVKSDISKQSGIAHITGI